MTGLEYAAIAVAAVAAGALNVAAAGGGVVVFLALTGLGMPAPLANATCLVATPFSFLLSAGQARRGGVGVDGLGVLAVCAATGSVGGVWLFWISRAAFAQWAPLLLLIAAMTLVAHPWLRRIFDRTMNRWLQARVVAAAAVTAVGLYAGYFGAGVGVLVLAALAATTSWPWMRANRAKNLLCLVTSVVGAVAYTATGLIVWPVAAVLAAGLLLGGLLGRQLLARLSGKDAEGVLREAVAVMTAFGAGVMLA